MMTTASDSCKDGASKSNDDGVCEVNDMLHNMSTADNKDGNDVSVISVCANCGKEGSDVNNTCNKCYMVKYCNAVCKKKHKKKHKKQCEEHVRLAAERRDDKLRQVTEELDDMLFKQPPRYEDCPICFLRIPTLNSGWRYMSCCGKVICSGCSHAPVYDNQGNKIDGGKCPFCRVVAPRSEKEAAEREKKRAEAGDPIAIYNQGSNYSLGLRGYPQDFTKAFELFHRAGELGNPKGYGTLGFCNMHGDGVEVNRHMAMLHYEMAAMMGDVTARYNLGIEEKNEGNMKRAMRHYMIAVGSGHSQSLNQINQLYKKGHATKDDYTKALRLYQEYLGEIKSDQRDKAAAANEEYRYYGENLDRFQFDR